jgi:drug/metabolite transporter (DMT)-like permease
VTERAKIVFGFILITIIWGSTWLVIKIGLESMPPLTSLALRFSLATLVLAVIWRLQRVPLPVHRDALLLYAILGVCSYSIPFGLIYWSEQYIPSGLASILFAIYPFVVAIGSHLFLPAERLTPWKVAGILMGFLGVAIVFRSDIHVGETSTAALLAVLASTTFQGSSLIAVKKLGKGIPPTALTLGGMALSLPVLYAAVWAFEGGKHLQFDLRGIGAVLYLGVCGTVVTFLTYYWLLHHIEAVFLSFVALATPVFAVILGALVLGEALGSEVFLGAALVLGGIAAANARELGRLRKKPHRAAAEENTTKEHGP